MMSPRINLTEAMWHARLAGQEYGVASVSATLRTAIREIVRLRRMQGELVPDDVADWSGANDQA